jgi:hypothetical protein
MPRWWSSPVVVYGMRMIRQRRGDEFLLVTQDDHAILSGQFAALIGNQRFAKPTPFHTVVDAVALHDAGWPLHDDEPTLNGRGEPLHVLETPVSVATRVWRESVVRAAARDPYAGLLVSLHVLNLSAIVQRGDTMPHDRPLDQTELFELNKFQHRQIEEQERLRKQLGLRTDLPLKLGLADPGYGQAEDLLRFNFGLLRAMDSLSLDICCGTPLFQSIPNIHPRPGTPAVTLNIGHPSPLTLTVDPWPFGVSKVEGDVPARRVTARPFESIEAFRDAYKNAPHESLRVRLVPI